ncbi:hypothetical protein [Pseudodesulfovibrio karagichevae]|uniref:Apea-like HEPN domain-containing protein n=1 Tax=Pseudodesulfovibrio karagichevae TaxID=3239305 RepID=A0ABV4K449_9BACT
MQALVEKALFVVNEINRIQAAIQKSRDAWKELDQWDVFADVPHPSGRGTLICGREAHLALCDIVRAYGCNKYKNQNVDISTIIKPFKKEFSKRFLSGELELNERYLSRVLHRVFQKAVDELVATTHFFPCRLYIPKDSDSIHIGPVQFKPASQFWKEYRNNRDSSIEQNVQDVLGNWKKLSDEGYPNVSNSYEDALQLIESLEKDVLEGLEAAEWIASSEVAPSSPNISRQIAQDNVETAIAIMKLAFGADFSQMFEVGTPPSGLTTPKLTMIDGKYEYAMSKQWNNRSEPKNFREVIHSNQVQFLFGQVACLLKAKSNHDQLDDLSVKLIYSLNKFSEAVRGISPEYSVLNYVIATETMLLPKKRDDNDITKTYAYRAAALAAEKDDDFSDLYTLFMKAYAARSAIAHGNIEASSIVREIPIHKLGLASAFVIYRMIEWLQDPSLPCQPGTVDDLEKTLSYILTQPPVCDLVENVQEKGV